MYRGNSDNQEEENQHASARKHTTLSIGSPICFCTGPFAGKTIRAQIFEVQKADLGRKCADPPTAAASSSQTSSTSPSSQHQQSQVDESSSNTGHDGARNVRKDRRPLDPPPVVSLKIFQIFNHGTDRQYEREIPAEYVYPLLMN